jgi:hypothetical protein
MLGTSETVARDGSIRGQLQDDLMRFEGRFAARLVTAFRPLVESPEPRLRLRATRDQLGFMTAALDIAVGSAPVVDLLDMLTLVSLGRGAMDRRWSVDRWGEAALGVADAFRISMDDIWAVAAGLLSSEVEAELREVIREWQRENPDNDDVTAVRLSAYAKYRQGSSSNTAGLFALLRGATQTADTAVLLGDRALYATQRLPNLVRLHVQIAGSEIAAEAQRAVRRAFVQTILPYGAGLSVVGAASWLLARVAYRRLSRR